MPSTANNKPMPPLVEGALANCVLGKTVQAMADVYGRYAGGPGWQRGIFPRETHSPSELWQ